MQSYTDRLTDNKSQDFAAKIGDVFTSLPHLPKNIVEIFVKLAPYFALLGAVLSLLAGPLLGIFGVLSFITLNPMLVVSTLIAAILSIISAVILFMAYKPLLARKYDGWMLLFWSEVVSVIELVVNIVFRQNGIYGIIGVFIAFYVLYEMRPWYGVKGKIETLKAKVS